MSPALISGSAEDDCLDSGAGEGEWNNAGGAHMSEMSVPTRSVSGANRWRPAANRRRPAANWQGPCCILSAPRSVAGPPVPANHLRSRCNVPARMFDTLFSAERVGLGLGFVCRSVCVTPPGSASSAFLHSPELDSFSAPEFHTVTLAHDRRY